MRKPARYYSLVRPKLRLSWNKHNVYNIARCVGKDKSLRDNATFFQMKWAAKSGTRGYHGEHITEKKWKRLFSHRLLSAVDMPPKYLAASDGSEQAAGRGSGLTTNKVSAEQYSHLSQFSTRWRPTHRFQKPPRKTGDVEGMLSKHHRDMTPYMQMAFAPLERRLEMAVFRAMFASSIRQARQFIVHGAVMVNGKKMVHPSYQLNPGDMFQVEPEKVLYATGAQKSSKEAESLSKTLELLEIKERSREEKLIKQRQTNGTAKAAAEDAPPTADAEAAAADSATATEEAAEVAEEGAELLNENDKFQLDNAKIKVLLRRVKEMLKGDMQEFSAKQKKDLRFFRTAAKKFLSLPEDTSSKELLDSLQLHLSGTKLMQDKWLADQGIVLPEENAEEGEEGEYNTSRQTDKALESLTEEQKEKAMRMIGGSRMSREEMRNLAKLIRMDDVNPVDETKPYATPWRPRSFMSAFAFIPRYLEVNFDVCAAVYLRHPMARKGMAEVPTPFGYFTNQLAHNWYLERGPRARA